jgi:hypothetical protein
VKGHEFGFLIFTSSDREVGFTAREIDVIDTRQDFEAEVGLLLEQTRGEWGEDFDGEPGWRGDSDRSRWLRFRALGEPSEFAGPARHLFGRRQELRAGLRQLSPELVTDEELAAEPFFETGDPARNRRLTDAEDACDPN